MGIVADNGNYGSILLSPDFAFHGDIDFVFEAIASLEAEIILAMPVQLTPGDVSGLYQHRISNPGRHRDSNSVWLSRHLHEGGPSLYMLTRRTGGEPLQAALAAIKGSSVRAEQRPNTIRGRSPLVERCFSLVHTPDDEAGLREDLRILFGPDAEAAALRRRVPLPTWAVRLLVPSPPVNHRNSYAGVSFLVAQILALIVCGLWSDRSEWLAVLERILGKWAEADTLPHLQSLRALCEDMAPTIALIPSLSIAQEEINLRAHASSELQLLLRRAMLSVMAIETANLCSLLDLQRLMAFAALPMSQWEAHRLMCLFSFETPAKQ
jgi:hypothetical protein